MMYKFRIALWSRAGFVGAAQYTAGPDSKTIRRRIERQHGREIAAKSAVTVIAPHPIDREVVA